MFNLNTEVYSRDNLDVYFIKTIVLNKNQIQKLKHLLQNIKINKKFNKTCENSNLIKF